MTSHAVCGQIGRVDQYFYLPALGEYYESASHSRYGIWCSYWSRTAYPNDPEYAYPLFCISSYAVVGQGLHWDWARRYQGYVVAPEWFK